MTAQRGVAFIVVLWLLALEGALVTGIGALLGAFLIHPLRHRRGA